MVFLELLRSNLYEIKKSGSLRTLGGLLALAHLLNFYQWWSEGHLPLKFARQGSPMCWSLFESCDWMQFIPVGVLESIYWTYAITMGLAALIFLLTNITAAGYYLSVIGGICGFVLYIQDLRLSSNEGYFILLATFAYLVVPCKHRLMRWLVSSYIVARGLSQASPDWLSGTWYLEHVNAPVKLAEWFAALSVLAQTVGGAALVFRDGRYFWTGWLSLFAFQCAQLYMGEVIGASLTLGAMLYVAFDELELRKAEREYIYQSFIRPEPSFIWGGLLLGLFWAAQLSPMVSSNSRISGLKSFLNIWALRPEAAQEECRQSTFAVFKDRIEEVDVQPQTARQPAMACNVYMRFLDLKGLCKGLRDTDSGFITLSSTLLVRNFREKTAHRAFEVADFCNSDVTFKRLGEIEWNTNRAK